MSEMNVPTEVQEIIIFDQMLRDSRRFENRPFLTI